MKKQNNKICIIIPYFGNLPEYFKIWLKSIEYNQEIDFLLITDDKKVMNYKLSKNIKIRIQEFNIMKKKIQNLFEFPISLERAYKLCDYRPVYGILFENELKKYKYWGFCDIDLVFGDIKFFLDKIEFSYYDRIFKRGHLSIFKNTQKVNNYFRTLKYSGKDYREVFTTDYSFAFDENDGTSKMFIENDKPLYHSEIIADIRYDKKRLELTPANPIKNEKKQLFTWERGKVFRYSLKENIIEKDEFIYLHFQKRNLKNINVDLEKDLEFFITPEGFYKKKLEVSNKDFEKYNSNKGNKRFEFQFLLRKIIRKIRQFK